MYERVAEELRKRTEDQEYLESTAKRARALAWDEIGDSLKERATHPYYSGGDNEEYQNAREDRIQQLIEKDLTSLMQAQQPSSTRGRKTRRKDGS